MFCSYSLSTQLIFHKPPNQCIYIYADWISVMILKYIVFNSQGGYTALMYAVKEDHVRVVRELLLAGADPTTRNKVLWCFF